MKTEDEIRTRLQALADTVHVSREAWTRINERYTSARPSGPWQSIRPLVALAASICVVVLGIGLSQRQTDTEPTSPGPSVRSTSFVEVAAGTTSGVSWSVSRYRDSAGRGCFEFRSQTGARSGRCEAPEPSQDEITTISVHELESTSGSYVMTALVAADAGHMTVTFLDGSAATVEVIPVTLDSKAFGLAVLAAAQPITRMAAGATVLTCDHRSNTAEATGGCVRY